MHKTITVSGAALVLFVLAAAPGNAQNREHQQMTAEMRQLQEQVVQLSLSLQQVADAIKALNARLDASDQTAQKRFADQELLIKTLSNDISAIRERTQDTDTRLRSLSDEIEALRSTVTSLPSMLTPSQTAPPSVDPATTGTSSSASALPTTSPNPPNTPAGGSALGLSPSRTLESAKADYFAGSYASAITGFEAVVKNFPTTQAAPEAYYYLGETFMALKRYQDATGAYAQVIQNYAKSTWLPDAYLKRGRAFEFLGQVEDARSSYQQLTKSFPESTPAIQAKQRLDALSRQSAAPTAKP
jgi:tol-pal system protein YbgF